MASDKIVPLPYTRVSPPESMPRSTSINFSLVPAEPAYIKVDSRPVFLVQSDFGDKTPQSTLREAFLQGNERKLVALVDASSLDLGWVESWEAYAADYIDKTINSKKGRKAKLALTPLIAHTGEEGQPRVKMTLDPEVLKDCAQDCNSAESLFDMPHGQYGIVFKVSGVWQNAASYGLSLRILKIRMKKEAPVAKRLKPSDYAMPDSDDEEV